MKKYINIQMKKKKPKSPLCVFLKESYSTQQSLR